MRPDSLVWSTRVQLPWIEMHLRSLIAVLSLASLATAQNLEVHVINVDQGLSVFLKSPGGKRVLIDGGNPGDGTAIVRPYLQGIGVTALDYSVMTHWHTDHFGGLTEVHNSAYKPLVAAYDRGDTNRPSNGFVTSYLNAVGTKRAVPTVGQVVDLGGGCTLQFVSRDGQHPNGSVAVSGDENAHSLGLVIRYGDFDLYVAGDLTSGGLSTPNVEGPVTGFIGQCEVAISSHHGSASSSSSTVVNNLNPSLVVHSSGQDNSYGHPNEGTVNNWSHPAATRVQWCTTEGDTSDPQVGGDPGGFNAISGHIVITSDGATFVASSPAHPESVRFATFEQPGTRATAGQVVVNELLVDPLAFADGVAEWFELMNVTTQPLNVGGMEFVAGAQSFRLASQVLLQPGELFVVGQDGRPSRNGNYFLGVGAPWQQFSLNNTSGSLLLRSSTGTAMETVSWGGSGLPVTPGVTRERIDPTLAPSVPNFAAATAAWSGGDLGTPGSPNTNWNGNGGGNIPACTPIAYGTGKPNSNGTVPYITSSGTPDINTNDFVVTLVDAVPLKSTILYYGYARDSKPFQGGTLLVKTPVRRMGVAQTDFFGTVSYPVPIDASMPGTKRFYQFWYRDPFVPDGTNVGLSAALEVEFCPLPPPPAAGQVVITEVMKDPTAVADSAGEWIELHNTTNSAIDIEGWSLSDNGGELAPITNGGNGVLVPAGGYLVIGTNSNVATNGGITVGGTWSWSLFKLDNNDDELVLTAPSAVEVDRIEYDNGFLWPDTPGFSLSLRSGVLSAVSNDDGNLWCPAASLIGAGPDHGTPGQPNDVCP